MSKDPLAAFKKNNSHVNVEEKDDIITVSKPWGHDDCILKITESDPQIKLLRDIIINPIFDAIIHKKTALIEFIYGFADPESNVEKDLLTRSFTAHIENNEYHCYYGQPSEALWFLAKNHWRLPNEYRTVPQLNAFKDFQRLEQLPESIRPNAIRFFERRTPLSFYVRSMKATVDNINLPTVAKSINFLMRYYDRETPYIEIREEICVNNCTTMRYAAASSFPGTLTLVNVDEIALQWMEKAAISSVRQRFLFYYQILEYVTFYYLDKDAKHNIQKIIKNPVFFECSDASINQIIDIIKNDHVKNDEKKMASTVADCADVEMIWREVENDHDFFHTSIEFDGGLVVHPLVKIKDITKSTSETFIAELMQGLTKIRNCIVHAREKRETISINPSSRNDALIKRILPVIHRLAEHVILFS